MRNRPLIPIGATMIIVCFFLPLVKACDISFTGVQLASDSDAGDTIFWIILAGGIASLACYLFIRNLAEIIAIISSGLSFLILFVKLLIPFSKGEFRGIGFNLEPGGFGLLTGVVLSIVGALIKPAKDQSQKTPANPL